MTHLGLNSAVAAAEKGFQVVCYDSGPSCIVALARHEMSVVEPGLTELFEKNKTRLSLTTDLRDLIFCDVVYISSDVPTDDQGQSDLEQVKAYIRQVQEVLRSKVPVVVLSQVPPGFTRSQVQVCKTNLYYQVETLIFGRALERALRPERIIIGCAQPKESLPSSLADFLKNFDCPILPMRYESAELAKISINMCLAASVTVANTLAELCEHAGADWSEIVPALKLDKRIGLHAYLAPGLGLSGGNLERDLATVCRMADRHGTDAGVVRAYLANSQYRKDWVLRTLYEKVLRHVKKPVLGVLGLSYKADTHSIKNSPSVTLIQHLKPYSIRVFDPVVSVPDELKSHCHGATSEFEACEGVNALLIMTPWERFKKLDPSEVAKRMKGKVLLDPYGVLDAQACLEAGLKYITLGARRDNPSE